MAKAPKETVQTEAAGFPVTLEEFLTEISRAKTESKAGFRVVCKQSGITGNKMRDEWQSLFDLYASKPTKISWAEWQKTGGR